MSRPAGSGPRWRVPDDGRNGSAALVEKLRTNRPVDPEVAFVWRRLVAGGGHRRIGDLAAEAGWSRKRLWSRFTAQIGVTPKRAAMLVRLTPAIEAILAGTAVADVATRCGYSDQAHLTRDLRELAGFTPAALYRNRRAVSHDVQDQRQPVVELLTARRPACFSANPL